MSVSEQQTKTKRSKNSTLVDQVSTYYELKKNSRDLWLYDIFEDDEPSRSLTVIYHSVLILDNNPNHAQFMIDKLRFYGKVCDPLLSMNIEDIIKFVEQFSDNDFAFIGF